MHTFIDHIVVVAPSLAVGASFIEDALGVAPQAGGAHARMGTHNLLLRLGDTTYLEIMASDPAASAPGRPRWFGLDSVAATAVPRLATWVARTDDIHSAQAVCASTAGPVEPMTRGELSWRITIPADGGLPLGGCAPTFIQWDGKIHPASALEDVGCRLSALDLFHPDPVRLQVMLAGVNFDGAVNFHYLPEGALPYLVAHIDTPKGPKMLS
ncbi:MAG TPA: VOC family protein [Candidimonas sp.]|nr:VOC family protein [Candidimonas sp.]